MQFKDDVYFTIADSSSVLKLRPSQVKVKIEASHAGIINKNNVFYTPKALKEGAETLLEPYPKVLQKRHYSKSVGPISKAYYIDTVDTTNDAYANIIKATDPKDLVAAVNSYLSSSLYKNNKTKGLGALFIEGTIYDKQKILDLKDSRGGHVSVAGDSFSAYCSICASVVYQCDHTPGNTYKRKKAFIIVDSSKFDHISFEDDPADTATHTYLLDNINASKLEIIDNDKIEGQPMKITISDLKSKLTDLAALYQEFKIDSSLESKPSEVDSDYLFVEEKLLPLNSQQNLYIAIKLLEVLEDSSDKEFLVEKVSSYKDTLAKDLTIEQIEQAVLAKEESQQDESSPQEEQQPVTEELATEPEVVAISKDEIVSLMSELTSKIETIQASVVSLQDSATSTKASLQKQEIEALRRDLGVKSTLISELQFKLKDAIINNALFKIKDEAKKEAFKEKVADKSLAEIQVAIELLDSLQDATPSVVESDKSVTDTDLTPVDVQVAIEDSNQQSKETDQEEKIVLDLVDSAASIAKNGVINHKDFVNIFRDTVNQHGYSLAKELSKKIKQKYTIQ